MRVFAAALLGILFAHAEVRAGRTDDAIVLSIDDREVLCYQAEPGPLPTADIDPLLRRGGYLHPVRTPSGRIVTADFPADHRHHHGIWFAWTKTKFDGRAPDFWNMGQGTGRVDFLRIEEQSPARFRSRHAAVDITPDEPVAALDETWDVCLVSAGPSRNVFDVAITQRCATDKPLRLPKHHYGGLGFRGPDNWTGDDFQILTSAGETDRLRANESRARWIRISGPVDGQSASLAILCHPENFRAPQPIRVHPNEPFVCFAPSQLGDMKIAPEEAYASRYRFIVADGPLDAAELDRLWNEYR